LDLSILKDEQLRNIASKAYVVADTNAVCRLRWPNHPWGQPLPGAGVKRLVDVMRGSGNTIKVPGAVRTEIGQLTRSVLDKERDAWLRGQPYTPAFPLAYDAAGNVLIGESLTSWFFEDKLFEFLETPAMLVDNSFAISLPGPACSDNTDRQVALEAGVANAVLLTTDSCLHAAALCLTAWDSI